MRLLVLLLFLSGCGLNPLDVLGSGVNTAANVQAGAENNQGVNIKTEAPSVSVRPNSRVETIDQSTTTNKTTTVDPLLIILLLLGWVLPSPNEMSRVVRSWFNRK